MMANQQDLFGAEPLAPFHKSATGAARASTMDAAESVREGREDAHRAVVEAVRAAGANGMTADELATQLGWTQFYARPRVCETAKSGRIVASGYRRNNVAGNGMSVWVTPEYWGAAQAVLP